MERRQGWRGDGEGCGGVGGGGGKRMTQTVLHTPVDEVPQVVEQFAVVLQQQVVPAEAGVLASKEMQSARR